MAPILGVLRLDQNGNGRVRCPDGSRAQSSANRKNCSCTDKGGGEVLASCTRLKISPAPFVAIVKKFVVGVLGAFILVVVLLVRILGNALGAGVLAGVARPPLRRPRLHVRTNGARLACAW